MTNEAHARELMAERQLESARDWAMRLEEENALLLWLLAESEWQMDNARIAHVRQVSAQFVNHREGVFEPSELESIQEDAHVSWKRIAGGDAS